MRVLHVIPSMSVAHGGPTRALALMERALTQQGVTVETAATDDDGPGRRNGKPCGRPLAENGVDRWYFPKRTEWYKASPALARWIAGNVRRFDLVHIHALFSFSSAAAARAAHRAGVPYIIRPLGTLNGYGMSQRRPWLKAVSLRLVEAPALRRAAAVHFTSEDEALQARQLGVAMREAIVPLGIEAHEDIDAGMPPRRTAGLQPRLLFLSRLDAKKNIEGLLEATALLVKAWPDLQLVIAGDGAPHYVAKLKARCADLGLSGRVTWAGHIEGAAKTAALNAADVFVLPSYSENFGIAALEALAAGLPVVLGKGVAIAKDVVDAGAGVAVDPVARSIAQGVQRIIESEHNQAAMSQSARRLAQERFSARAMAAGLKSLYLDILDRNP
jgi:glycosyltransferase involved in cell wall biosynthesis